jgi:TrpR-related protein YerC/YecD
MEQSLRENENLRDLFDAMTLLDGSDEIALFFRDLCTLSELESMAERWQVAQLVEKGISYRRISELTGASTTTVTRIAHWLRHGEGGYRLLLDRVEGRRSSARSELQSQIHAEQDHSH